MRHSREQHLEQHNNYNGHQNRDFRGYLPTHLAQTTGNCKSNLPLDQLIECRSLCSMYKQFHQRCCILLEPPLQFGQSHSYSTRTSSSFSRIVRCNLNFSQNFFRSRVTHWWNSLPSGVPSALLLMQLHRTWNIVTLGSYLIFVSFVLLCCS